MPSTSQEQYLLELVNDARMDPMGDAARYIRSWSPLASSQANIQGAISYFGVSGAQLLSAFQSLAPAQPLAWSDVLAGGARAHDSAMIAAGQQTHQAPGEADLGTRFSNEGYAYTYGAENVYAYAQDGLYTQAGFMIDWGGTPATGGMQADAGHRVNIMNPLLREVGIGVTADLGDTHGLGPNVVTEDFGTRGTSGSYIVGVDYADEDGDGFYTPGEGVAGLMVSVGGSSAVSGASGGYTLSTNLRGFQQVTLAGGGLQGTVTVAMSLSDGTGAGLNTELEVVGGNTLRISDSATVSGAVSAVRVAGVKGVTLAEADGVGRTLTGNAGDDTITGGTGDDRIDGGAGHNTLDGSGGSNTVVLGFASTSAKFTPNADGSYTVTSGAVSDTLSNFRTLSFTNATFTSADPLFDVGYYLSHNPDVAAAGVDPLQHYLASGWKEGRNPDALFDDSGYLQRNPDVAAAGVNPLLHYEAYGWKEGREPSMQFLDSAYLAANPDVKAAGVEPLAHYLQFGRFEGRAAPSAAPAAPPPDPLFDATYYLAHNPDVFAAGVNPLQHYLTCGWHEGRNPDAMFDVGYYLSHNPDVAAAGVNPLAHYEAFGWKEGRDPSAAFSTRGYLTAHPDVAASGVDPLVQWYASGAAAGYLPVHT